MSVTTNEIIGRKERNSERKRKEDNKKDKMNNYLHINVINRKIKTQIDPSKRT